MSSDGGVRQFCVDKQTRHRDDELIIPGENRKWDSPQLRPALMTTVISPLQNRRVSGFCNATDGERRSPAISIPPLAVAQADVEGDDDQEETQGNDR